MAYAPKGRAGDADEIPQQQGTLGRWELISDREVYPRLQPAGLASPAGSLWPAGPSVLSPPNRARARLRKVYCSTTPGKCERMGENMERCNRAVNRLAFSCNTAALGCDLSRAPRPSVDHRRGRLCYIGHFQSTDFSFRGCRSDEWSSSRCALEGHCNSSEIAPGCSPSPSASPS